MCVCTQKGKGSCARNSHAASVICHPQNIYIPMHTEAYYNFHWEKGVFQMNTNSQMLGLSLVFVIAM